MFRKAKATAPVQVDVGLLTDDEANILKGQHSKPQLVLVWIGRLLLLCVLFVFCSSLSRSELLMHFF